MILLLSVFSLTVYTVIRSALIGQFDSSLVSVAWMLAGSVEVDGQKIELEFEERGRPELRDAAFPTYYQLWRGDGTVAAKSAMLGSTELGRLEGALGEVVLGRWQSVDGEPFRTAGLKFRPRAPDGEQDLAESGLAGQTLELVVARDAGQLAGQLRFLRWLLAGASAAVAALSLITAYAVVRAGLRPLDSIAAEIAAISQEDLSARIAAPLAPSEIVPIRDRLNGLLSRLEQAFERERRFTADVAHELRTPLAGLRSMIEVTRSRGRDVGEYEAVLAECLGICVKMQAMVNNLLVLARLDARQVRFCCESINLAELANSQWKEFADKAAQRRLAFKNLTPPSLSVRADREYLCMVLRNVLANAAEYADEGGRVRLRAARKDGMVEISVSNSGCRLSTEQVARVFDCFWRADQSRTDAGVHCGIGLALVERIVHAFGGTVAADVDEAGTFTVRLTIPEMPAEPAG